MLVFTPNVPEPVIVPPVIVPSVPTLVTVPCGGVIHSLVVPEVVVVTFCATDAPEQVAVPVLATVEEFASHSGSPAVTHWTPPVVVF